MSRRRPQYRGRRQSCTTITAGDPAPPSPGTGSGLFYKDGREIPPTHPDHGPMHLIPRQEDGGFAAYYYCSKAELYDAEVGGPPPRRQRRDGFTPELQEAFLEEIRGGASGREAARRVGISPTTAYNRYNSPDGAAFRSAWDEAARVTDIVLEDTAFDRAVNGEQETVYHKGEAIGTRVRYDNKLLMQLLRARNPLKYAPLSEIEGWLRQRGIAPAPDVDGALDRLRAAEQDWGRRLPGEEARPALADRRIPDESARLEPTPPGPEPTPPGPEPTPVRPEPAPVRPEPVEACPERLPKADSRRGPFLPSGPETEDRPSTGSGRTEAEGDGELPAPSAPPLQSTSSTSPGNGQREDPAVASTSSTSSGNGQDPPAPEDPTIIIYRPPPRPRLL